MANATAAPSGPADNKWTHSGLNLTLAILLVLIPLVFKLDSNDQFELPKLVLTRTLTSLGLALLMLRTHLEGRFQWRRSSLDLPLALWAIWNLVKTLDSYSPAVSWRGEYENFAGSLTQLNFCLLYFMTTQSVTRWRQGENLALTLIASAAAVAVYALMQALGLDMVGWAKSSVISDRFFSSLGNPNFLAALMIMTLPLILAVAIAPRDRYEPKRLWCLWFGLAGGIILWSMLSPLLIDNARPVYLSKFMAAKGWPFATASFYLLCLVVSAALLIKRKYLVSRQVMLSGLTLLMVKALADTGTRGAYVGGLAALLAAAATSVYWLSRNKDRLSQRIKHLYWSLPLAGLVTVLVVVSLSLSTASRDRLWWSLTHPVEAVSNSRAEIWGPSLEMIRDHPLTGMGVDTFKTMFPRYSGSRFNQLDGANVSSRMAHSEPLNIAATMGLIGLGLWAWIMIAWARHWLAQLKRRDNEPAVFALVLGLGALFVAYHVQNIFSFGVASITVPFWIMLGLLFADPSIAQTRTLKLTGSLKVAVAIMALGFATAGPWLAFSTYRADRHYNFGHMVSNQVKMMDNSDVLSARAVCDWAIRQLNDAGNNLDPVSTRETAYWQQQVQSAETMWHGGLMNADQRELRLEEANRMRATYIGAARGLLWVISAWRQEKGVTLCPGEVKYHVFLGLAFEELFKISTDPLRRKHWFERAMASYSQGVHLNPENAYYHGNKARLWGLSIVDSTSESLSLAEQDYFEAIKRAGVTPLFYDNLNLLYAQTGHIAKMFLLCEKAAQTEERIGGRVYFAAGTAMFQWSRQLNSQGQADLVKEYQMGAFKALEKAALLNPSEPDIPHNRAVFHILMNQPEKAKAQLAQALKIDPAYSRSLDLARSMNWKF